MIEHGPCFSQPPTPDSGAIIVLERDEFIRNYVECILKWYGYTWLEGWNADEISKLAFQFAKGKRALLITEWSILREDLTAWSRLLADGRFSMRILGLIDEWEAAKPPAAHLPVGMTLLTKPFSPPELAEFVARCLA